MDVFLTGFSKKLLVAISVSVIIAMCLTPAEAASLTHRQLKQLSMTETKEMAELPSEMQLAHRRRHQRHTKMTKVEEHMLKIRRNLKLTKNDFREHKDKVSYSETYRDHKIKVPATNFLEIHRLLQSFKNKTMTTAMRERKFVYIAVKLYKSLFKYSEIFQAIQNVNVVAQDVEFSKYQDRRKSFLSEIIRNLNNILPVIGDGIRDFKKNIDLSNPLGEKEDTILQSFKSEIAAINSAETCLKYDGLIFRGYGILLKKWYCIVSSKQDRTHKENMRCRTVESKVKSPKKHRKQKKKRRVNNI
ncbi:uncharacterized protein LOC128672043 isoform X2 [Plodia interpunctella]|uniref:uncharacterized protein LOC128672043 isoform X2 n=1 Tax=Plodia interpunctella TaxID=58824 RepID=UPI0023680435|nr:uncharacterized protein LOC128672043 isoform X2 [Plodia interpunctella]